MVFLRTTSLHPDFVKLVKELDEDLRIRDGDQHEFYAGLNKIDNIKHVLLAFDDTVPVACGSFRQYEADSVEVKRMYVIPERRSQGIASSLLEQLECWAAELSFKKCILETGQNQPEAIRLYKKNQYRVIPNFGKYEGVENSICFEKTLKIK